MQQACERIDVTVRGLRDLITDLRPPALDELGLLAALEALIERVTRAGALRVDLDVDLAFEAGRDSSRLSAAVEDAIYRLVQEALTNILKHAGASHADVIIREHDEVVEAVVSDNGKGFDPELELTGFGPCRHEGAHDRERARRGTTLRAVLPNRRAGVDRKVIRA